MPTDEVEPWSEYHRRAEEERAAEVASEKYRLPSRDLHVENAVEGVLVTSTDDRRKREEVYGMPTRVVVLREIADAIRPNYPLEALMLANMAKSMETNEDSGHVLFNRRVGR